MLRQARLNAYCLWCYAWLLASIPLDAAADEGVKASVSLPDGESISMSGAYAPSIPLDFPPAAGELPVPVSIVYGSPETRGPLGLGWEVPLSYVRMTTSVRGAPPPPFQTGTRRRVEMSIAGSTTDLRIAQREGALEKYHPFVGSQYVELIRDVKADVWRSHDAAGRTFLFTRDKRLNDDETWLLSEITDVTGEHSVRVHYDIVDTLYRGQEVLIDNVEYSFAPETDCPKFRLRFLYQGAPGYVSSAKAFGTALRTSGRILTTIAVEAANMQDTSCSDVATISSYSFDYQTDPWTDTYLLWRVMGAGLNGEQAQPVIAYTYGDAISSGEVLYGTGETVPMPTVPAALRGSLAVTARGTPSYSTALTLSDFTGDGRADLVFASSSESPHSQLRIASHVLPTHGTHRLSQTSQSLVEPGVFDRMYVGSGAMIDWNGDGRLDVVQADELSEKWKVHINVPDPSQSTGLVYRTLLVQAPFSRELDFDPEPGEPADDPVEDGEECQEDPEWCSLGGSQTGDGSVITEIAQPRMGFVAKRAQRQRCISYTWSAAQHRYERTACPGRASEEWTERSQWEVATAALRDVNADGYPDFVYSTMRPRRSSWGGDCAAGCPASVASLAQVPAACARTCTVWATNFDLPRDNELQVRLHAGLNSALPETDVPFGSTTDTFRTEAGCGLERHLKPSAAAPHGELVCGVTEVNGDGYLDWMETNWAGLRRVELGVAPHWDALANGHSYFTATDIVLPGPVELTRDLSPVCASGHDGFAYKVSKVSDLIDLTGDGIPDYVFHGFSSGATVVDVPGASWWLQKGTGYGFGPPLPIRVLGSAGFALSEEQQTCGGSFNRVTSALLDFDGDGRFEVVHAQPDGSMKVHRPFSALGQSAAIVDDGRIIAIEGASGVRKVFTYASAKDDPVFAHQTPSPEIVVDQVQTLVPAPNESDAPAIQYFAYAGSSLMYNPVAQRFVPTGYTMQARLIAAPSTGKGKDGEGALQGFATLSEAHAAGDFPGYAGLVLVGKEHSSITLSGYFDSASAWPLLSQGWYADSRAHAGSQTKWAVRTQIASVVDGADGCADHSNPYVSEPPSRAVCQLWGYVFPASQTSWQGDDHPVFSDRNTETRGDTLAIDAWGRPLLQRDYGDVHDAGDDRCTLLSYAKPKSGRFELDYRLQNAATQLATDCEKRKLLSSATFFDDEPLGTIARGLVTRVESEVFRTDDGSPSAATAVETYQRTSRGVLKSMTTETASGSSSTAVTTTFELDPFELVPLTVTREASDVAFALVTRNDYEPYRILRTMQTRDGGATTRYLHDARGRVARAWLERDGKTYFLDSWDYLGEYAGDPAGKRVVRHSASTFIYWDPSNTPLGPSGLPVPPSETEDGMLTSTSFTDPLGRPRFTLTALGADYGGELLREGYAEYDAFGRARYTVGRSLASEDPHTVHGTTHYFDERGRSTCQVLGTGPQPYTLVADPNGGTFPSQTVYGFAGHRAQILLRGPDELTSTSGQYGASDVQSLGATGRLFESFRERGGTKLSWTRYAYDTVGNVASVTRATDAASSGTGWVTWSTAHDALGRTLAVTEPSGATTVMELDSAGRVVRTSVEDEIAGEPVLRTHEREFDGFGRPTSEVQARLFLSTGQSALEGETYLTYDRPCDSALQSPADSLLGRLACSVSAETKQDGGLAGKRASYYAYDDLGRTTRTHRREDDGVVYTERWTHDLARLQAAAFELPDTGYATEETRIAYDTAGRPSRMTQSQEGAVEEVFSAEYDSFGRPLVLDLGNGVREAFGYRPDQRRELRERVTQGRDFTYASERLQLDGSGRVLVERVSAPQRPPQHRRYSYDARNDLVEREVRKGDPSGTLMELERFQYDSLGNLGQQHDVVEGVYTHHHRDARDPDRLCSIQVSSSPLTHAWGRCDYEYDRRGNMVSAPDFEVEYDVRGLATRVKRGGNTVRWREGTEGRIELLETDSSSSIVRHEINIGPSLTLVRQQSGRHVLERRVAGPLGALFIQRGPGRSAPKTYVHGDRGSNAFFSDDSGMLSQYVGYSAFGRVVDDGGDPADDDYRFEQWNGGIALPSFGLSEVGVRLYDPALGRFLQRDPLMVAKRASDMNPYAFASNDPINRIDPTGLDDEDEDEDDDISADLPGFEGDIENLGPRSDEDPTTVYRGTRWSDGKTFYYDDDSKEWMEVSDIEVVRWAPTTVDVSVVWDPRVKLRGVPHVVRRKPGDTSSLAHAILDEAGGRKIHRLTIVDHGMPGVQGLGKDMDLTKTAMIFILPALVDRVNVIELGGCWTGFGIEGERLMQVTADFFNARVDAYTGTNDPDYRKYKGVIVQRVPGQPFDRVEILARQFEAHLLAGIDGQSVSSANTLLNSAKGWYEMTAVRARITTSRHWPELKTRLNATHGWLVRAVDGATP